MAESDLDAFLKQRIEQVGATELAPQIKSDKKHEAFLHLNY